MKTVDGIKKIPRKLETQAVKQRRDWNVKFKIRFSAKQAATILVTFALTFLFSVATSKILALRGNSNNSSADQLQSIQSKVLGASTDAPDNTANSAPAGLAVVSEPIENVNFDNIVLNQPPTVFLPNENIYAPDPLVNRADFLKQYLNAIHSPLADHVSAISEQSQWKLIVAIAQAESSSCKKYPQQTANCWGIGGASNLMQFKNLDQAIAHVNQLLEQKYISKGLTEPQSLVNKWVGHPDNQWEQAVEQVLQTLQNVQ